MAVFHHHQRGLSYYGCRSLSELADRIQKHKQDKSTLTLRHIFKIERPLQDSITLEEMMAIGSKFDLLEKFRQLGLQRNGHYPFNPEDDVPPPEPEKLTSYSDKVETIFKLFTAAQKFPEAGKYIYIYVNDEHHVSYRQFNMAYPVEGVQRHIEQENDDPYVKIIMAMDLTKDFDDQIRSGDITPESMVSFENLKRKPLVTITVPQIIATSPTVIHPNFRKT
ncbi:MAG: hypothetical protein AAF549_02665 [Pseudomonadota bacterium]